ncbi:hypothetical protein [Amycolatopsis sp. NPDC058986]|uniref:hypothetical protein n=1 Tax=unclassified Amycolatopsis TaxID=2618356 RepID=UPI00366ED560
MRIPRLERLAGHRLEPVPADQMPNPPYCRTGRYFSGHARISSAEFDQQSRISGSARRASNKGDPESIIHTHPAHVKQFHDVPDGHPSSLDRASIDDCPQESESGATRKQGVEKRGVVRSILEWLNAGERISASMEERVGQGS